MIAEPHAAVRLVDAGHAFMVIFAMPTVVLCSTFLLLDRTVARSSTTR
jgi:hypothetical protein